MKLPRLARSRRNKVATAGVVALAVLAAIAIAVSAQWPSSSSSSSSSSIPTQSQARSLTSTTGIAPAAQGGPGSGQNRSSGEHRGSPRGPTQTPASTPPPSTELQVAPGVPTFPVPYRKPLDPADVAVWRVETAQKVVALTFDDGPSQYTPRVVAALEQTHTPATFFCIGQQAEADRTEIVRLKAAGFEVENHTWNHALLTRLTFDQVVQEIRLTEEVVGPTRYLRPPGGYYNPIVREAVASQGMMLIRWNVDTRDWQHQDIPWILSRVETEVRPGSIILMHDGGGDRSQTASAVPLMIAWLRSQGYGFVTVNQLLTGGYGPARTDL